MKVQVTYELTVDERIAIGLDITGQLIPCTRAGAKLWFDQNPHGLLAEKAAKVGAARDELRGEIIASLKSHGE